MDMPISDSDYSRAKGRLPVPIQGLSPSELIAFLTERQLSYLRLVQQNHNSKEIAQIVGTGYRAVDKQLMKANNILGVGTRFEAARMLADYEAGVGSSYPANALPSEQPDTPLSPPWPTAGAAVNMLSWRQVATWITIVSIVTPVGLTAAGMAYYTLLLLLRLRPY